MPEVVVNFGGGLNSTALLIEAVNQQEPPPRAVLFADTGGERYGTLQNVARLDAWLRERGWPGVTVVNNYERPDGTFGPHKTLEEECITNETLPGLAYGHRGCSRKWKVQPMDRWIRAQEWAQAAWARGERVVRWIGYDADETHRAAIPEDGKFAYRYPLLEWGVGRVRCRTIIEDAGLPIPTKSACFFCPAMKKAEVLALAKERPEEFARAVEIERASEETRCKVVGLGVTYSWERLVQMDEDQRKLFPDRVEPCVICWDGEEAGDA